MTAPAFNAIFRPLVAAAWQAQCACTGRDHKDQFSRDIWYRDQLQTVAGVRTTKGISGSLQTRLIDHFRALAASLPVPLIHAWSPAQNARFADLATKAFHASRQTDFRAWLGSLLDQSSIWRVGPDRVAPDRRESFDDVMSALAIIARDEYWIERTSHASEIRMRWQIGRFLDDMDYLTKTTHTWDYIRAIWKQAEMLPADISEAPAQILWKILQMLDTHIRRLCADYGISPAHLPSRDQPPDHPVSIRENNSHLHVGHAMEHCDRIAMQSELHL